MAKIIIKLREIHVIKADDGLSQGPDLYPVVKFNGSVERKSLFGPQHDNLLNNKGYPFNDTLLEVEIPMGEFAEFFTVFYDNDGDSSKPEQIRDAEIKPFSSYKLPEPLLQIVASTLAADSTLKPGINGSPSGRTFWLKYEDTNPDDWEVIWATVLLFITFGIANAESNADDEFGSWRTRINVTQQGIFFTSQGVGVHSGLNTGVLPAVIMLDGEKETAIPKLSYWIHEKRHVDFSMTAQVIG